MSQNVLVFQQAGSGLSKISGIEKYGGGLFDIEIFNIDQSLPPVIDETAPYLPRTICADLVLDFLKHPDLSYDLAKRCFRKNIPVVASGQKERRKGVLMPPVCCALSRQACLGSYGKHFGSPEFNLVLADGIIERIYVLRGAPCGATWQAAERVAGMTPDEAVVRIGLETQFFCSADPSGWDPIYGRSPVHLAGKLHGAALRHALVSDGNTKYVPE